MLKRILLIDIDNKRTLKSHSQLFSNYAHHPIGLLYLSSALQQHFPEIEIRIFHTITSDQPLNQIDLLISQFQPDLIGLRALSIAHDFFNEVAENIRRSRPDIPLIAGGPLPSSHFESLLTHRVVDLIIMGEGEETIIELIKGYLENKKLPDNIHGTATLENSHVKVNAPRPYIQDLDKLPFPNYDLINLKDYNGITNIAFQDTSKCAFICSSRGCPFNCFYCHQFFGKKIRRRSPENIVNEMLEHVEKRGIKDFAFVDDCFNVPIETAKKTLRLIAERLPNIKLNFSNGMRADHVDDELVDLLEKAGTAHIAVGLETASPRLQKIIGKNLSIEKAEQSIDALSKRFILHVYFMVGFPSETYEEAMETVKFAARLEHISQPVLSITRIFKGTPLYNMLQPNQEQADFLKEQEVSNFQPRIMSKDLHFYGDVFPKNKVPLSGNDITALRFEWFRKVLNNKNRIHNSYRSLRKHLSDEQVLTFYKNFYDNPNFDKDFLHKILGTSI